MLRREPATPSRALLLRLVEEQPGLTVSELAKSAGRQTGIVRTELRTLSQEGLVVRRRQSGHRLHFAATMSAHSQNAVALLRLWPVRAAVQVLVSQPGVQAETLATKTGQSRIATRRALKRLIKAGLVKIPAGGRASPLQLHPELRIAWVKWIQNEPASAPPG